MLGDLPGFSWQALMAIAQLTDEQVSP